ncbi:DUF429 domain-containing protein [Leekyejoonella antrihumi]|uniref:DUF429 domain-containing protein n=2 Tax=Leekyejoonella antrihumi TaxID=1660198 RepID=A0A563E2W4_9MICO|nr:DUF429 domain-containing protein [Leekyejoonella antrihumi]
MHFAGLDLAWGNNSPTGVAVLDDLGTLQHLSAVQTDAEVVAALSPYLPGGCLVGIDAPLIVRNEKGSRPAEKQLNRDFARFDAGAHPSNTSNPTLGEPTRGARICARLRLDMDPGSRSSRRAIEVYPHPATIALFRLGRTLKYKNKQGRTVDQLRGELLALMRLLDSLASAAPALQLVSHDGWRALVGAVERATRKSELRQAEDQVDAVVCAYVALLRERLPDAMTMYGDFTTGYIVTPTLPGDLEPSPRRPRITRHVDVVRQATQEYAEQHPQIVLAAEEAVEFVTRVLDDAGLNYLSVTGRAKSVASFAEKAGRTAEGNALYADPLAEIGDVIGLRVITYVHSDVAAVVELLDADAVVISDRDMGQETAREGHFGYVSRHLQIRLAKEDRATHPAVGARQVQVQVRTVLQHAWAEFEHDIRYKGTVPEEHRSDLDRRFTLAAGLLELADREFSTIRERLQGGAPDIEVSGGDNDPRISPRELAAFLAGQYADASWSRPDHYAWMAGLVLELGIASLSELAEVIRPVDTADIARRMAYRSPTGAVRRLDDALLIVNRDHYIGLHGNAHRTDRLRARLAKMTAQG